MPGPVSDSNPGTPDGAPPPLGGAPNLSITSWRRLGGQDPAARRLRGARRGRELHAAPEIAMLPRIRIAAAVRRQSRLVVQAAASPAAPGKGAVPDVVDQSLEEVCRTVMAMTPYQKLYGLHIWVRDNGTFSVLGDLALHWDLTDAVFGAGQAGADKAFAKGWIRLTVHKDGGQWTIDMKNGSPRARDNLVDLMKQFDDKIESVMIAVPPESNPKTFDQTSVPQALAAVKRLRGA